MRAEKEYYVYCYLDPREGGVFEYHNESNCISFDHKPIYIGKGKGLRLLDHWQNSRIDNKPLKDKLNFFKKKGIEPIIRILFEFDKEEDAYDKEEQLIALIGSFCSKEIIKNGPLCNVCCSGRPPSHKGKTYLEIYGSEEKAEEQRKKRHDKQLEAGGFFKGRKHTDESRLKMSESLKGKVYRPRTDEEKRRQSEIMAERHKNGEMLFFRTIYKVSKKEVEYYLFGCLNDFASFMGLCGPAIANSARNKKPVSRGRTKGWICEIIQSRTVINDKSHFLEILKEKTGFDNFLEEFPNCFVKV